MDNIKVLVVDDSALMRKIISDMINSQSNMEVVATARNGKNLFDKLNMCKPDVITLDVEMPIMNGIEALREIRNRNLDIPVIVLSSFSKKSSELTMDCLQNGAFDFIPKPSGTISLDIDKVQDDLITKINLAYKQFKSSGINHKENIARSRSLAKSRRDSSSIESFDRLRKVNAVVIGASTGGPKALYKVITTLPENLNVPVFVVQHMPATFTKAFADRMNANSKMRVVEAKDTEIIESGTVYIAPGGFHMEVESDTRIHLNKEPAIWGVRPAVDKLFTSASNVYKDKILSVILTGMGRDGAKGTEIIKDNGGVTIAEDESTCTIYGMPKAAFETGKVDMVLPLDDISMEIVKIVKEGWR